MSKSLLLFALVLILLSLGGSASAQQYPVMDRISNKVIRKYQQSSREQLWQKKGEAHSPREQEAVQLLHGDPQMRAAFIDRVAAPIANKMFECGLIP